MSILEEKLDVWKKRYLSWIEL